MSFKTPDSTNLLWDVVMNINELKEMPIDNSVYRIRACFSLPLSCPIIYYAAGKRLTEGVWDLLLADPQCSQSIKTIFFDFAKGDQYEHSDYNDITKNKEFCLLDRVCDSCPFLKEIYLIVNEDIQAYDQRMENLEKGLSIKLREKVRGIFVHGDTEAFKRSVNMKYDREGNYFPYAQFVQIKKNSSS